MLHGTLSQGFRGRWTAGRDTWNTFAGIPCQVGSGERHLTRFRRDSVPGGRQGKPPDTLSWGYRVRWRRKRTPGTLSQGYRVRWRRDRTPGTLSQGFRGRWTAGRDTWNTFAGIPWQVGTCRQGHTVVLRRAFPQCGPLPFSGADAGFGLCMSLASRFLLTPDVLT